MLYTPSARYVPLKPTGAKLAVKPVHVWGIRVRLQVSRQARDLALFDLALDSKLRGCDLVRLRVLIDSHQPFIPPSDRDSAEALLRRQLYSEITASRMMAGDLRIVAALDPRARPSARGPGLLQQLASRRSWA